jgi:hypothetical protein
MPYEYSALQDRERLTAKQWYNLSLTFSPTASKVARRGAKNPYPMPPKRLPPIPMTGQRTKGTGNSKSTAIFRTKPSLLVLQLQTKTESNYKSKSKYELQ